MDVKKQQIVINFVRLNYILKVLHLIETFYIISKYYYFVLI